jgi:hypothetical protein
VFESVPLVNHYYYYELMNHKEKQNPNGIVSVKYNKKSRGTFLTPTHQYSKSFRNTLTVVACYNQRLFHFKIFSGDSQKANKTQHPGAKNVQDVIDSLMLLWTVIPAHAVQMVPSTLNINEASVICYSVMTNINFNIGFCINRLKLFKKINTDPRFSTLLDIDNGHTGVNIKMKVLENCQQLTNIPRINLNTGCTEYITSQEYCAQLNAAQLKKELAPKHSTFIVFYSGKIIMSCCNIAYMKTHFDEFMQFIHTHRESIQDKSLR